MLFETGHPWITFKDACNVVRRSSTSAPCSSNLYGITLNTGPTESLSAIGSVNLLAHMHGSTAASSRRSELKRTITTAMRMLTT